MSEELKPCPFCGGEAKAMYLALHNNAVECTKCKCSTPHGFINIEQAIIYWNRRQEAKPLTMEQIMEVGPVSRENAKAIHAALPPDQSARIVEMEAENIAETRAAESAENEVRRLWEINQQLQADRNFLKSKIARAIEILKKPHKFDQDALVKLFNDTKEAIEILEEKPNA